MRILAIDFDDTIHNPYNRKPGYKLGVPMDGAVEGMQKLYKEHNYLVVHCVWADTPEGRKEIMKWLDYFEIPYHSVTAKKPAAHWYIDDRGYHFENWTKLMADMATDDQDLDQ